VYYDGAVLNLITNITPTINKIKIKNNIGSIPPKQLSINFKLFIKKLLKIK
jgi:hypothetical protein